MKKKLIKLRLVPVKVFGTKDGYGLMDAVSAWSDCNRATGHIYRVDDIKYRGSGETVDIFIDPKDKVFFDKNFDEDN